MPLWSCTPLPTPTSTHARTRARTHTHTHARTHCPPPVPLLLLQRANFELDDFLVFEVFHDVCQAVAYMHKNAPPLAHRDLKAENVLKNSEGRWVICDFGSSTARAQVGRRHEGCRQHRGAALGRGGSVGCFQRADSCWLAHGRERFGHAARARP